MSRAIPKTHVLHVEVSARTHRTVAAMIDQLARAACDIANSTDDEHAYIAIWDDDRDTDGRSIPIS